MRRQLIAALAFVVGLLLGLWLGPFGSSICLDRRDYAPGRNTYRLVWCEDMPSYHEPANKWSGN